MNKTLVGLIGLACLAGSGLTRARPAFDQGVFRSGVQLVFIDASVRRKNATVTGLTSEDFTLQDNGVQQKIELQPSSGLPLDVTLVFEQGMDARLHYGFNFKSDVAKIGGALGTADRARVIGAAAGVREFAPMQPADELIQKDFTGLDGRPAGSDSYWDALGDPDLQGVSMIDALLLALAWPEDVGRRHLVVAFSTGEDDGGILQRESVEPIARRADALLHLVMAPLRTYGTNKGTFVHESVELDRLRHDLTAAAAATGGEVHNSNDGVKAFKSILADFKQSYVLRYTLTGVPPEGWHTVVVKTPKCPDCTVHARTGYFGR